VRFRTKQEIEYFIRGLCEVEGRYCGEVCSRMRAVDNIRVRHDYERTVKQGDEFVQALKSNHRLCNIVSNKALTGIIEYGSLSYLNSLYKSGRHTAFRQKLRETRRQGDVKVTAKLYKRYMLSYIKSFVSPQHK